MSETGKIEADSTGWEPDWLHDRTEVTLTVQDVANRLHRDIYGPEAGDHKGIHSCPCFIQARWFLGLDEKPKLYWPDGKGGNAHDKPRPNPYVEILRLRDAVVEAAVADRAAETGTGHNSDFDKMIATRRAFRLAVTALLQFEQEHSNVG